MTADQAAPGAAALSRRRRGMLYMLLTSLLLVSSDALAKLLAARYPVGEILFFRSVAVMVPVLILVRAKGGLAAIRIVDPLGQVARAVLFMSSSVLFIASLSWLALPFATALSFVSPIFMTLLAIPLLGERVDWRTWCAILVGFGGVVVALDPFDARWHWSAVLPVAAALAAALRDIMTRRISRRESSTSILFYSTLLTILMALVSAPFGWRGLALEDLPLLLLIGGMLGAAHYLYIDALRLCEVSVLAPLKYSMILWSLLYGSLIWQDVPGLQALAGTAVIIASGIYVVRRPGAAA